MTGIMLGNFAKAEASDEEEREQKDEMEKYIEKIESRNLNVNFFT